MNNSWWHTVMGGRDGDGNQYSPVSPRASSSSLAPMPEASRDNTTRSRSSSSAPSYSSQSFQWSAEPHQTWPLAQQSDQETFDTLYRKRSITSIYSEHPLYPTPPQSAHGGAGWQSQLVLTKSTYLDSYLPTQPPTAPPSAFAVTPQGSPPLPTIGPAPRSTASSPKAHTHPIPYRASQAWSVEEESWLLQATSFTTRNDWKAILPDLNNTRGLKAVKKHLDGMKQAHYFPLATRQYGHPLPTPAIGPHPSPDSTPWTPEEDAELLRLHQQDVKGSWSYGLQARLGSGRSVRAIRDRLDRLKALKKDSPAITTSSNSFPARQSHHHTSPTGTVHHRVASRSPTASQASAGLEATASSQAAPPSTPVVILPLKLTLRLDRPRSASLQPPTPPAFTATPAPSITPAVRPSIAPLRPSNSCASAPLNTPMPPQAPQQAAVALHSPSRADAVQPLILAPADRPPSTPPQSTTQEMTKRPIEPQTESQAPSFDFKAFFASTPYPGPLVVAAETSSQCHGCGKRLRDAVDSAERASKKARVDVEPSSAKQASAMT